MTSFRALDHVGFAVGSLDRSIPFYTAFLGEEPFLRKLWDVEYVGRIVGYPGVVLDAAFWHLPNGTILELLESGGKAIYPRDPDGISIELIQLPPGGPKFQ